MNTKRTRPDKFPQFIRARWHQLTPYQRTKIFLIVYLNTPTSKRITQELAITTLAFVFIVSILPHHLLSIPIAIGTAISTSLTIGAIRIRWNTLIK